jgi:hypothetical protein
VYLEARECGFAGQTELNAGINAKDADSLTEFEEETERQYGGWHEVHSVRITENIPTANVRRTIMC